MNGAGISAPEPLTAEHDVSAFDSGTPELDNWLKRRALANEALGTSRTYVVTDGGRVVAFYALANGAAAAQIAGIRAVLLHAMSDDAKRFYARAGFYECPVDPMMMMITLAEVEKNLSPPR